MFQITPISLFFVVIEFINSSKEAEDSYRRNKLPEEGQISKSLNDIRNQQLKQLKYEAKTIRNIK